MSSTFELPDRDIVQLERAAEDELSVVPDELLLIRSERAVVDGADTDVPRTLAAPDHDASLEITEKHFGVDFRVLHSMEEAVARIGDLVGRSGPLGVFTCNVDHLALMRRRSDFREAYDRAAFVTADGAPIVAFSRLVGRSVGKRITGADLVPALAGLAAARGLRLALVGGAEGVAEEAAQRITAEHPGLSVVLTVSPPMGFQDDDPENAELLDMLSQARPDIVIVAFGAPRQELWIDRHAASLPGVVFLGAGASIDFVAGRQKRAPVIFMKFGLEWAFRLATNFRRLWRRYLVQDTVFVAMALKELFRQTRRRSS